MGRMVHFEITADDMDRATQFYKIFDWDITESNTPGINYSLAHTGKSEIGIDGAIMSKTYKNQPSIIWIAVDDIEVMMKKVVKAGGSLAGEKHDIPDIGYTTYVKDTEGNIIGLIQPFSSQ